MKNLGRFYLFSFAILFSFFVFGVASYKSVFASVDKIAFINKPQTIPVNVSSGQFQIQIQDSSGAEQDAPFTIYFTLPLELGIFSSQKDGLPFTNSSSIYIATGASNKYFYFKSSNPGTYLLRIKATNKDKTLSWEAEQTVVVGSPGSSVSTSTNDTDLTNENNNDNSAGSVGEDDAHYEQESLSNYEETVSGFKVSAGRERVTYVGSPVSFEAKVKISGDIKNKGVDYVWSFGDGSSSSDEKIIHTYKYPGEYNVVLNATLNDVNSIARTKVKVLAPNLILSAKSDGAVEILNKGAEEINLYGWKLQAGNTAFVFPLDTIISANKSVIFPSEYTKISGSLGLIILADATNKGVAQIGSNLAVFDPNKVISAEDFQRFVVEYQKSLELTRQPATLTAMAVATTTGKYWSDRYDKVTKEVLGTSSLSVIEGEDQTGTARSDLAVPEPDVPASNPGFWSKVFHPVRTIKNAFYK